MKKWKIKIEEEWYEGGGVDKKIVVTLKALNMIAALREVLKMYFNGSKPDMAGLHYLDFDPRIDKDVLPTLTCRRSFFTFVHPNDKGTVIVRCQDVTVRRKK